MSSPPAAKLKVGGTLGLDDLYIRRTEDEAVYKLLAEGEYCNVLTSRQMGKSSLMVRLIARLTEERGARIASVDMAGDIGTPADADSWYVGFLDRITLDLGLSEDIDAWWREKSRGGTPNQRLLRFFREVIGASITAPVYIFVDEVDATLKLPYSDDFFTAVRSIYNQRSTVAEYRGLTFCLLGVASPGELIKDRRTTAYNIGHTIELRDFDPARDNLKPLHDAMSAGGAPGEETVRAVLGWTGGHPFLTVALCAMAIEHHARTAEEIDRMVVDVLPATTNDALKGHFESINTFLGTRLQQEGAALRIYGSILRGKKIPDRITPAHLDLRLSGLVKRGDDGCLVLRNRLYARRFGRAWLAQTRPMKTQARIVRASAAFSILVVVAAGFVVQRALSSDEVARAKQVEELQRALEAAESEAALTGAADDMCALLREGRQGDEAARARMGRSLKAFWARRAERFEELGQKALAAGDIEKGLVFGALAGVKRGELSGWVRSEYARSDGPALEATLRGHVGSVNRVRFLGADRLVSVGVDSTLRLFNVKTGGELKRQPVEGLSLAIDACADGGCVVTASSSERGDLWSADLEPRARFKRDRPKKVYSIAAGPGDDKTRMIAMAGEEGIAITASLLILADPAAITSLERARSFEHLTGRLVHPVYSARLTGDGRKLITASFQGVQVFSVEKRTKPERLPYEGQAYDARPSLNGELVVLGNERESAVYNLKERREEGRYRGGSVFITSAFSPGEKSVVNAATSDDGRGLIVVWRVQDGERLFRRETASKVRDAEFGADPGLVASAQEDGTIRLWRLDREETVYDVHALWMSWQRKFGLTIGEGDQLVPLGPEGARPQTGYSPEACRAHRIGLAYP